MNKIFAGTICVVFVIAVAILAASSTLPIGYVMIAGFMAGLGAVTFYRSVTFLD